MDRQEKLDYWQIYVVVGCFAAQTSAMMQPGSACAFMSKMLGTHQRRSSLVGQQLVGFALML